MTKFGCVWFKQGVPRVQNDFVVFKHGLYMIQNDEIWLCSV